MQTSEIQGWLLMKNYNKFDINSFVSPDAFHSPVYVWVWNDVCTREVIDKQLTEMQKSS